MLTNHYAVITGEMANSKKVPQNQFRKIPDIIRESIQEINRFKDEDDKIEFETIRMDEFLCMIKTPQTGLHSLLMLASYFRFLSYVELKLRVELKLSLAIGPVEFVKKELRESDGTAFRSASNGLSSMKRNQRLLISTTDVNLDQEFAVACGFMDIIIHDWSDEQAEALFHSLTGKNQMQISEKLNISQPAVNRRLKAAHLEAIEKLLKRYKQLIPY